ncbi:MAG: hypothetical protein R2932_54330 [Caldilineaceae bacterium]
MQLASGDLSGAARQLTQTITFMRQANFTRHLDEVVATQVLVLLAQDEVAQAAALAESQDLPLSQARVCLAQGDFDRALALIAAQRDALATPRRMDHMLQLLVLQIVALEVAGQTAEAQQLLGETLALAEPGGFIRLWWMKDRSWRNYWPPGIPLLRPMVERRSISIHCWLPLPMKVCSPRHG